MWYGKDTDELIELKKRYEELFGYNPDGEMEFEYDDSGYNMYVEDIKRAIKERKHIAEIVE